MRFSIAFSILKSLYYIFFKFPPHCCCYRSWLWNVIIYLEKINILIIWDLLYEGNIWTFHPKKKLYIRVSYIVYSAERKEEVYHLPGCQAWWGSVAGCTEQNSWQRRSLLFTTKTVWSLGQKMIWLLETKLKKYHAWKEKSSASVRYELIHCPGVTYFTFSHLNVWRGEDDLPLQRAGDTDQLQNVRWVQRLGCQSSALCGQQSQHDQEPCLLRYIGDNYSQWRNFP